MSLISLPSVLVVTMLRLGHPHTFEVTAGYYGNCISLAESIRHPPTPLIISAECRVKGK
jgi:hypothetical protein